MRIKLIANPISGGDARPRIEQAMRFLAREGAVVDLYLTGARGDARVAAAKAVQDGYDRIIAAGGDGTLNEVVNGVFPHAVPVAFLPFGTVNVFALEAGIPLALEQACALAVDGSPKRITLGRVNNELFLLMVSCGWDAEAVAGVRTGLKRIIGRLAYGISALESWLLTPPRLLELTLADGSHHQGYGVVVSNCHYYGGRYVVTPGASMFSDRLDICLLKQGGRMALLKFALSLLLKRPLRPPLVEHFTSGSVDLSGSDNAVQVDGDDWGTLPIRVEAVPDAVNMILPMEEQ